VGINVQGTHSVKLPNGFEYHGVPIDATREQVKANAIAQGFATEEDFAPPPMDPASIVADVATPVASIVADVATPVADELGGLADRLTASVDDFNTKGQATTDKALERMGKGTFGPSYISPSAHMAAAGIEYGAGRAIDVVTSFTPQEIQDGVGDLVEKGMTAAGETVTAFLQENPKAMAGVEALKQGYEAFTNWANDNPVLANDMSSVFDVTSALLPPTKIGPVLDKTVGRVSRLLKRKGTTQSINQRREGIKELVYPENKIGEGITSEGPLPLRTRKYRGTMREDEITEALVISDVVDPNRTFNHNQHAVSKKVASEKKALDKTIRDGGNPKVDIASVREDIQAGIDDLQNLPNVELLVGDGEQMAQNFLRTADKMFAELGPNPTALQLLNMRRKFDIEVARARGNQFDATGQKDTAITLVNKTVRDSLNNAVMKALPNSDIYHSLRHQHLMLSGYDILRKRMFDEQENTVKRLWHNVARLGHLPKTPLALGATAVAAAPLATPVSAAATVALGGYLGYKGITGSGSKKALGSLLAAVNKSINASENHMMIETLKADRLILIEMIKQQTSEDERPPLKEAAN